MEYNSYKVVSSQLTGDRATHGWYLETGLPERSAAGSVRESGQLMTHTAERPSGNPVSRRQSSGLGRSVDCRWLDYFRRTNLNSSANARMLMPASRTFARS